MPKITAWLSRTDACALALMRDVVVETGSPELSKALARLPAFQRLVRRACIKTEADELDHVLVDVTPGMLAALRAMGFCGMEDGEGRPVCVSNQWPFWAPRLPKAVRKTLKELPGAWSPTWSRITGTAPVAERHSEVEMLGHKVMRQTSILQTGDATRTSEIRDAKKFLAELRQRLHDIVRAVQLVNNGRADAAQISRSLNELYIFLQSELVAWLQLSSSTAKFRERFQCPSAPSKSTVPPQSICYMACHENAALFALRLTETAANSALLPLNNNANLNNIVHKLTEYKPARLFGLGPSGSSNAPVNVFKHLKLRWTFNRSSTRFRYGITREHTTQFGEEGLDYTTLGLTPAGVIAVAEGGYAIEDRLSLDARKMSHIGAVEAKEPVLLPDVAKDLGAPMATRGVAWGKLEHFYELQREELAHQHQDHAMARVFNQVDLNSDKLDLGGQCQKWENANAQSIIDVRAEISMYLKPHDAAAAAAGHVVPTYMTSKDSSFANIFFQTKQPLLRYLMELLPKAEALCRREVMLPPPNDVRRDVILRLQMPDLHNETPDKLDAFFKSAPVKWVELDLDEPGASNLVRYMICTSKVPACRAAFIKVSYVNARTGAVLFTRQIMVDLLLEPARKAAAALMQSNGRDGHVNGQAGTAPEHSWVQRNRKNRSVNAQGPGLQEHPTHSKIYACYRDVGDIIKNLKDDSKQQTLRACSRASIARFKTCSSMSAGEGPNDCDANHIQGIAECIRTAAPDHRLNCGV